MDPTQGTTSYTAFELPILQIDSQDMESIDEIQLEETQQKQKQQEEEEITLYLMCSNLKDKYLRRGDGCLIVQGNSISVETFGLTKEVYEAYKYADVISTRQQLYDLKRCIIRDRDDPGSVKLVTPPNYPSCELPSICTLFSQYGYGKPVEDNPIAKSYIEKSKDKHLVQGLKNDTAIARLENFKKCIANLEHRAVAVELHRISLYFFPLGIGKGYRVDDDWLRNYLPILKDLSKRLLRKKIVCTLVAPPHYKISSPELEKLSLYRN